MAFNTCERGFTLVEVMVAMMIVALALPALLGQAASLSQQTFHARAKTQAFWVAQNRLAEIAIDRRLNPVMPARKERDSVNLGRNKWDWTTTTQETSMENLILLRVEVTRAGEEDSLVGVTGFIRGE